MRISDWSSDVCSSDLVEDRPETCTIRMVPEVQTVDSYKYYVVPDSAYGTPFARYAAIAPHISSGVCKPTGVRKQACTAHRDYGWPWPDNKYCDDYYAPEYECTADLQIGRASCRERGCQYVEVSVVGVTLKKKK